MAEMSFLLFEFGGLGHVPSSGRAQNVGCMAVTHELCHFQAELSLAAVIARRLHRGCSPGVEWFGLTWMSKPLLNCPLPSVAMQQPARRVAVLVKVPQLP
jgi:hypothetical protein